MAKPYKEGKTWSIRVRVGGQDIYRPGFKSSSQASKEAERLRQLASNVAKPAHHGPWATTVSEALQLYAQERLPFMKGAVQDACKINRYLRPLGLDTIKVTSAHQENIHAKRGDPNKILHWTIELEIQSAERHIPNSLVAHRQAQAAQKGETDRLRKQIAQTPAAQVTKYQLQALVDAMGREGYKPATIGLERALLRTLFNYAKKVWLWPDPIGNPATDLKMTKIDNGRNRVLTNKEWKAISKSLKKCRNPYVAPALALLLESAMRVSEPLLQANWDAVDFDNCLLQLRDAKAGARGVPLSVGAIDALHVLKNLHDKSEEPDQRIIPISYEALKAAWKRTCQDAGVAHVNIHDLRHTAATRYTLELCGNLPVLKVITGHKTDSQLARYINVKPEDVARLLHGRPLMEDNAPAGLHASAPKLVTPVPTLLHVDSEDLPSNVVPLRRAE